jgi:hypothetical protein
MAENKKLGNETLIYVMVGEVATPVAAQTNATLNIEQEGIPVTSKDSGRWVEEINGLKSWSIDFDALMDYSTSYGFNDLFDVIDEDDTVTVRIGLRTGQDDNSHDATEIYYEGVGNLRNLSRNEPVQEVGSYSCTVQGTGALTRVGSS